MNDNQTTRELEHRIAILELKLRIAELERDMALEGMSAKQGESAAMHMPLGPTHWVEPTRSPTVFYPYVTVTATESTECKLYDNNGKPL